MSQDEGFLQAIIEEPDDVGLRLIYADWLDERGDPRGEFIRVQCQLEGLRWDWDDPEFAKLKAREIELLNAHEREWLGPLGDQAEHCVFRRGFLEYVAAYAAPMFIAEAEELFRYTPLLSVHLFGVKEVVAELAAFSFLKRLRCLDLTCNDLTAAELGP